jgi:hypothetical protein
MKLATPIESSELDKEKSSFSDIWKAFGHAFSVMQGADQNSSFVVQSEEEES